VGALTPGRLAEIKADAREWAMRQEPLPPEVVDAILHRNGRKPTSRCLCGLFLSHAGRCAEEVPV
jgi:hypothetical protein